LSWGSRGERGAIMDHRQIAVTAWVSCVSSGTPLMRVDILPSRSITRMTGWALTP
jgi:hypothetical protein